MKHYVEIVRHFRRVGDETLPPELRTLRTERRPDKLLDWSTVLSSNSSEPVILLAPSGTGKSTELQAQARVLRASKRHAVFGEARALVDGFDFGLTHEEKGAFASWKATADALVLFIDAVDELYLRNRTLRDLLRALDRELNLDTKRTRLVFSARNGSWTAASTQELLRLLRLDSSIKSSLLTFEPLDSRAVRQLAISEGVPNADTFMQAFDEEVAAFFELRPTDVALLVSQWRASARFGNWSQIISDFVAASFGEENPERIRARLLSPDEGRSGVMRIAGACLLMRQPHVTVPTLSLVPGAISSRRLFDDWPFAKLSEFFENSLFVHKGGEAEAVQLPQGVVSHFLAAQWFAERIRRGLPVETLRNTLMVRVFDEKHYRIPAAHRAAIGWIASEIAPFRRLLLEDHPRIALFEGDAEKVPDAEIRIGLRAHCKQLSESGTERFIAATVVRKLARPTIETEVRALLERYKNSDDVQWHLLQFVEHGESLTWDHVPRVRLVAARVLCACAEEATEASYYSALVYRWFISLVARAFSPGCKVDTALILQGEQGVGKSSFFRKLAGEWFSDTEMGLDKDALLQMRSTWIYEWAELENVTSRHAMSRVKAFLTSNEDRFRPPFGRAMITVKRSGVIVGTTNREEFLHDPSGSRRFWVVPVGEIDLPQLEVDRDQLLAEAVHLFRSGERWWLSPEEEAQRADTSSRFVEVDPWEAQVLAYAKQHDIVRTADILRDVLEMALERRDRKAEMRIAAILRRNGYFPDQRRVDGEKCRVWLRQKPSGRLGQPPQVAEMAGGPNASKRDR